MSTNVLGPGPNLILSSSSSGAGDWHRVHPRLGNLTFQVLHVGCSVGATGTTVSSTVVIEASNDGSNALATVLGTFAISGDSPQSDGFTADANWSYIRAKINSVGAASAGSTGSNFAISVRVSAQLRS